MDLFEFQAFFISCAALDGERKENKRKLLNQME